MNSVKNLFVIVMLMGVSYGAYQVIATPDPSVEANKDTETLDIGVGPRTGDAALAMSGLPGLDDSSFQQAPKLPPLPEDSGSATFPEMPALNPPPLVGDPKTVPELPRGQVRDPEALAGGNFESPAPWGTGPGNTTEEPFATPMTPPALAPESSTSPPLSNAQPIPNGHAGISSNGGAFNPNPSTKMTPVVPKPDSEGFPGSGQRVQEKVADKNTFDEMSEEFRSIPNRTTTEPPNLHPTTIDWQGISELANSGQPLQALQKLSLHYEQNLPQDQRLQLQDWLDALAGKVIYSTEHLLLSSPYIVQQNDTLDSIAAAWNVPAELIYNVNRSKIGDPSQLVPGTELKAIAGPFNAVVNLEAQELTLFLKGMYAGRFQIELGQDGPGIEHGSFLVEQKLPGKEYTGQDGQRIAAAAVNNPYGKFWIGLNDSLAIHESNPLPGQQDQRGSIRLSSRDAQDVFGILSSGSQVTIRR